MDKLVINGIKVLTLIGVHPWEQQIPQHIHLDIAFQTNAAQIAEQDSIIDAIDYDKVVSHIVQYTQKHPFKLIESLAHHLANELLAHFPTEWVEVTLHKPGALKTAKDVAITVQRSRA
jgi:dihydroneopterin aldolase